ncbi:MAG: caspase family protein [Myxococcota bacterium]
MPSVRRFALVVGANDGGSDRVPLQFAGTDAHAVALVLKDIGGVRSEDLIELSDPTPAELTSAFAAMSKRLRAAAGPGVRLQLVFYYSGHSDEQGLLLEGSLVKYPALRSQVQSTPADVKIAILDSCASGAFTRLKGGKKTAPFLVGSAAKVEGHAFLTSSSADEAAQESDRVGGSFFTHYLTTGLRGAADVDKDKIVTLSEAYEFAFDETLARTEATRGGPQHAAYDIQLAGSGDLVMTDLRRTSARLEIMPEIGGRIFVRSGAGNLAAELYKAEGNGPVLLALESGAYQVTVDDGETLRRADIRLSEGRPAQLTDAQLSEVTREGTVTRGTQQPPVTPAPPKTGSDYDEVPFNAALFPPVSINGASGGKRIRNKLSVAAGWSRAARIDGMALGFGAVIVDEEMHGLQGAFGAAIVGGTMEGWQFAMSYNGAKTLNGAQTGFVNHAETIAVGAQLGLVNHVETAEHGAQIGLVNVGGSVGGAQLGLVNYARDAKASLGIIAVTKEYGVHPEVWTSDAAAFNAGIRVGAKYTYSFLNLGFHPFGTGAGWLAGGGIGGHIPIAKRFFVDMDLGAHAFIRGANFDGRISTLASIRAAFGMQIRPRLSVFGGPTVRVLHDPFSADVATEARGGLGYSVLDEPAHDSRLRVWPGFFAGLRF